MNPEQLLLPDPNAKPQEWIAAAYGFFRQLNEQDPQGIAAVYQTLELIEASAGKNQRVSDGTRVIKEAAKAKMVLLVAEARMGGVPFQLQIRNFFFEVTHDKRFS